MMTKWMAKGYCVATVGAAAFPDSDHYDFLVYRSESLGKLVINGIFNQNA